MMRRHALAAAAFYAGLAVCTSSAAFAQGADKPGKAAIASAHVLATQAGFETLAAGGNAE